MDESFTDSFEPRVTFAIVETPAATAVTIVTIRAVAISASVAAATAAATVAFRLDAVATTAEGWHFVIATVRTPAVGGG